MTALPYIAAYLLGLLSFGVFMLAMLLRVHRTPPPRHPTRQNRDRLPEVHNVPPMPVRGAEMGVNYQWINITGLEDK